MNNIDSNKNIFVTINVIIIIIIIIILIDMNSFSAKR